MIPLLDRPGVTHQECRNFADEMLDERFWVGVVESSPNPNDEADDGIRQDCPMEQDASVQLVEADTEPGVAGEVPAVVNDGEDEVRKTFLLTFFIVS
jgi:hypothetical protein